MKPGIKKKSKNIIVFSLGEIKKDTGSIIGKRKMKRGNGRIIIQLRGRFDTIMIVYLIKILIFLKLYPLNKE